MDEKNYLIDNIELMKKWDYEKNLNLNPSLLTCKSGKKAWWRCEKSHSFEKTIYDMNKHPSCPYCIGRKIIKGFNDFATKRPELLLEWDWEKNIEISPFKIPEFSPKRAWWKCKNNHSWSATVINRSHGYNCPYCSNQKIKIGENDLETKKPMLAKEWNYEKNIGLLPYEVTVATPRRVWWKCIRGHEWIDSVNHRNSGRGCPECSKGLKTSFPEQAIFFYISKIFENVQNRYMGLGVELDIFIPSINVGIEYDGGIYHQNIDKELKKIEECRNKNIILIKIIEPECCEIEDSRVILLNLKDHSKKELEKIIYELIKILKEKFNIKKDIEINLEKDNIEILSLIGKRELENSLLTINPNLAKEWDYEKNGKLLPSMLGASSSQKVWWKCPNCQNSWKQSPNLRKTSGYCPKCSKERFILRENDFASKYPELIQEWNYEKNEKKPNMYKNTSNEKVWWKCSKCNYEWEDEIFNINDKKINNINTICPICRRKETKRGIEINILEKYPEISKEWDYEKNKNIDIKRVKNLHKLKVFWICNKGHSYESLILNRIRNNTGCPYCSNQKLLEGFNDFATTNPELAKEWNYEKNYPLVPTQIISGGKVKYWWKCLKCNYEWNAQISSRKQGGGCPKCSQIKRQTKQQKKVGMYDLITGELIKVYNSVKDAEKEFNNKNIGSVCTGKRKSAAGYFWKHL